MTNVKKSRAKIPTLEAEIDRLQKVIIAAFKADDPRQALAKEIYSEDLLDAYEAPKLKIEDQALWNAYRLLNGYDEDPNRLPRKLVADILQRAPRSLQVRGLALEVPRDPRHD